VRLDPHPPLDGAVSMAHPVCPISTGGGDCAGLALCLRRRCTAKEKRARTHCPILAGCQSESDCAAGNVALAGVPVPVDPAPLRAQANVGAAQMIASAPPLCTPRYGCSQCSGAWLDQHER
jgi:hypothetical protein